MDIDKHITEVIAALDSVVTRAAIISEEAKDCGMQGVCLAAHRASERANDARSELLQAQRYVQGRGGATGG